MGVEIPAQMASNAENVSTSWRRHESPTNYTLQNRSQLNAFINTFWASLNQHLAPVSMIAQILSKKVSNVD